MSPQSSPGEQFPSGKIINIQALRGIAVLLVVAYHITKIEAKYSHGERLLPELLNIGISGVDLFFVISGFVMVTVTRGWFQKQRTLVRFLYHRVTRIYPTYWFYSLIVLAVFLLKPEMVNTSLKGDANILFSFLLVPQHHLPLLAVGWTLVHEMYFYLVFAVLLLFPEKRLILLLLLWGLLVLILPQSNNAALNLVGHPLTFEFIAGALIALILRKRTVFGGGWLAITALLIWLLGYLSYVQLGGASEPKDWQRVMVFGIPAVLAVYGVVAMELNSGRRFSNWLVSIGNASYSIYLSHVLVLSALGRIWAIIGHQGLLDNGVAVLIMLFAVLITGNTSYRFLERPLLKFTRRYEGVVVRPAVV